jgi:hypothetical protein
MISDHVRKFKDTSRSDKIQFSAEQLADQLNLPLIDSNELWKDVLSQRPLDSGWTDYWKTKSTYFENVDASQDKSNDSFWWNNSYGVFLQGQTEHAKHYYIKNNKPLPFNSTDTAKSYFKSCPSCYCTFLYNKKLYKCAALGTLKQFLEKHESIDSPEWQKYLSYKPLDLTSCTLDEVENFSTSKFQNIDECSMCPENNQIISLTEETVLPIKFYKNKN